jgi:hypothetical protein
MGAGNPKDCRVPEATQNGRLIMFSHTGTSEQSANGYLEEAIEPSPKTRFRTLPPVRLINRIGDNVRAMPLTSLVLSGLAGIGLYALLVVSSRQTSVRPDA